MSLSTEHFLYTGIVKHRRYTPFNREFSYPIFMLYLDINDLNNVMKKSMQIAKELSLKPNIAMRLTKKRLFEIFCIINLEIIYYV